MTPEEKADYIAGKMNEGVVDVMIDGYAVRADHRVVRTEYILFEGMPEKEEDSHWYKNQLGRYESLKKVVASINGRIKRKESFKPFNAVLIKYGNPKLVSVNSIGNSRYGKVFNVTYLNTSKFGRQDKRDTVSLDRSTKLVVNDEKTHKLMAEYEGIKKRERELGKERDYVATQIRNLPQPDELIKILEVIEGEEI